VNRPIDDLDHHLAAAGSLERAGVPLAMYFAWCANLHLLGSAFTQAHEGPLLRLRYRELNPLEFLFATTGGAIRAEDLNAEGKAFSASYYPEYAADLEQTFGEDPYSVQPDWAHYEMIARVLTQRYMAFNSGKDHGSRRHSSTKRSDADRKWWQVWRR
jgi:hypothetical protein